jgi:uncharacterized protein DUF4340
MKIRGLLIASLVFVILAGVLYWSNHRKPEDTAKASADTPPAILKLDQAAITKLQLKKRDAEPILLAKAGSGDWKMTEPRPFPVDQTTVSSMLFALSSLNSERLVDDKPADLKRYGLQPAAFELDISTKDKTHKLLLGDDTPTGGAVYATLAGDPRVYALSSYGKSNIEKGLNDLRDKRLITASSDKISRLELIRKNQDIEFGRNKDEWRILKPKPLRADSSKVDVLIQKLIDARMDLGESENDSKAAASKFAGATPVATVKVTDQSGTQEVQLRKRKDAYYAKSSITDGAYKVGADLAEALNKDLEDFRSKKLFDFGFEEPSKVELHNGSKAFFLTRSGEDWWSNGKKMDPGDVGSVVSRLRDLTATRLVDSGFSHPTIEATVTSGEGKRVEKVQLAKSATGYIAKRENDPSLYQLDSSPVDELLKAADEIKPSTSPAK